MNVIDIIGSNNEIVETIGKDQYFVNGFFMSLIPIVNTIVTLEIIIKKF